MSSCGKPSYKKNEILKSQTEEGTESIINDSIVNQKLNAEQQIASALLAAPVEVRDKAMVYGYGESGKFMILREGSNEFVCIADNPEKDGFQVVGYHLSLEPMMAKGRTLNAQGKSREEKEAIREEEALGAKAKKRIDAIQTMKGLGVGYYLAMHDLEIRGAGEVLGESQSGEMFEIGFNLYSTLLDTAIKSLKEGHEPDMQNPLGVTTEINLHAPSLLPDHYCNDIHERLVLYKRMANCENSDQLDDM